MQLKNTIANFYFTLLFTLLMIHSCSANPPEVVKQIGIKINWGTEQVYQVPSQHTFFTGDTVVFRAIINSPYFFNGWSGGITGNENPYTLVVTKPLTITINYNTALNFQVSLENSEYLNDSTFQFDVMIRTFTESFSLTAYQCALVYNTQWRNSNKPLNFSYVNGSSELTNIPQFVIKWDTTVFRFTFASASGNDTIGVVPKRIGRFKVTIPQSFLFGVPIDLKLFFNDLQAVTTIFAGEGISNINQYGTFLALPEKHKVTIKIN